MATVGNSFPVSAKKYGKVVITLDNVLIPVEKLKNSPSLQDGLDPEIELDLRILGCELIQTSGILLKLPQFINASLHSGITKRNTSRVSTYYQIRNLTIQPNKTIQNLL
ncbi:Cyclin-L1 [Armadillidium vulgare]|nr:Cyclin-L1 [Armadillidium vulgare]